VNADGIMKVTTTLQKRLSAALTAAALPSTVFVGPLDDPSVGNASLILFLYRIIPSATLRNGEHRVPSPLPPPPVLVFKNALPLDLYYLLTVGTTPGSEEAPLQWLGVAMQAIQAEPDLTGPDVNHEAVHVSLETLTTDEASRIWALFPNANYRTSVSYLATPVWIDPLAPEAEAGPVIEDQLRAAQKVVEAEP
jgi:Pvc16 N-terminal domain